MTVASRLSQLRRVSKKRRCPICGRADWCLLSDDGAVAICPRIEAGAIRQCGEAGWLHLLSTVSVNGTPRRCRIVTLDEHAAQSTYLEKYATCSLPRASESLLSRLAVNLNVSVESLHQLKVGWDGAAWIFPMRDENRRFIGLRRRFPNGSKRAARSSCNGLFIPIDLLDSGMVLIAERETDCAALLTLGFNCVGRPSCSGGVKLLQKLARGRDTVIIADHDGPGQRGAATLAFALLCYCPSVRIVVPPGGIEDARQWIQAGGTYNDLMSIIRETPPLQLHVRARARRRQGVSARCGIRTQRL